MNSFKLLFMLMLGSYFSTLMLLDISYVPFHYRPIDTQNAPAALVDKNHPVRELYEIVKALEKYKVENKAYPVSLQWTNVIESGPDWILGLTPNYIHRLPVDKRMSLNSSEQYSYISDGANFKLLSIYPTDCLSIGAIQKELLFAVKTGCVGYGYWTRRSRF